MKSTCIHSDYSCCLK